MRIQARNRIRYLCQAAMIAALYVVLTELSAMLGLASMTPQCRLGEALAVLPLFMPAAVPGLAIGCLITNLILAAPPLDLILGTFATLLGAVVCRQIGRVWHTYRLSNVLVATIPNALANTLIVPIVLQYAYGLQDGYVLLMLSVGAGEVISGIVLGTLLALSIPLSFKKRLEAVKIS